MKLPDTFDVHMRPTVRSYWYRLYPNRRTQFWWYVGCVVRMQRIPHKNAERIKEVCAAVDERFPQYRRT